MKSDIETRKSQNQIGHILWQLNEIWPTGGWGSLEYGNSNFDGQVIGKKNIFLSKSIHFFLYVINSFYITTGLKFHCM
jgi:hypothetical protein